VSVKPNKSICDSYRYDWYLTTYNAQFNISALSFSVYMRVCVCVCVYIYICVCVCVTLYLTTHSDLSVMWGTAVLAALPVCRESWSTRLVKQITVNFFLSRHNERRDGNIFFLHAAACYIKQIRCKLYVGILQVKRADGMRLATVVI
jgi:hypothetical protein